MYVLNTLGLERGMERILFDMLCEVMSSVGRVLEFPATFQIQFSQNNLQKDLLFIFHFLKNNLDTGAGRVVTKQWVTAQWNFAVSDPDFCDHH